MKKNLLYLLASTLIFGACHDDTFGNYGSYSEGKPATLSVTIKVPAPQKITSRAMGQERETAIEQFAIIAWEINSGRKMSIDFTGKLTRKSWTPDGASSYSLTEPIPVLTGHYRAYCIANWESYYGAKDDAGTRLTFSDLKEMTEAEIQQIIFWNFGKHTDLYGNDGFPMTHVIDESYNGGAGFVIGDGPNELKDVNLDRASAHIHFKIKNGSGDNNYTGNNKPDFVPRRYAVYRAPLYTNAFKEGESNVEILQANTFDTGYTPIVKQPDHENEDFYEFDFHMLQNKQRPAEGIVNSIADRERWDYTTATPEVDTGSGNTVYNDRKFTNAPPGATFVVIEGTYSGPAMKENGKYSSEQYIGTISYIIHLGNFNTTGNSPANHPGSFKDYSVLRNELQTYEITVEGAHSIILNVEVEDGQHNPAVEGELSQLPLAYLDAHYAKIMMRIPTATISPNADDNIVTLSSVTNGFMNRSYSISELETEPGLDYKWVQFQSPGGNLDVFPKYAGVGNYSPFTVKNDANSSSGYGYITDLARDLAKYKAAGHTGQGDLKYAYRSGDYFYTAAFVDENIYPDPKWPMKEWAGVNAKTRRIIMTPGASQTSPDGTSILAGTAAINISQKPVSSTYSLNADMERYNPFGLEQVMEPTSTVGYLNQAPSVNGIQLSLNDNQTGCCNNGHFSETYWWDSPVLNSTENNLKPIDATNPQLNTRTWFPNFDLGQGVADDKTSFYKISDASDGSSYVFVPAADYNSVTKGLLVHNRDLNGDGYITGNELRWYIPDFVQFLIYSYGYNLIPEELRLQSLPEEAGISSLYPSAGDDYNTLFPRYLTSSNGGKRLYWQDQNGAASYLYRRGLPESPAGTWMSQINRIRFARNLGQYEGAATDVYTLMSQHHAAGGKKNSIRYLNPNIARNYDVTGFYPFHYCTDDINHLPYALEYDTTPLALWNTGSDWANGNLRKQTAEDSQKAIYSRVVEKYKEAHPGFTGNELPDGWRIPNQRELMSLYVLDVPRNLISNYEISEVISCTFIQPTLWSARHNLPVMLSAGLLTLPNAYARYYGYVILVRDVDPYTGIPVAAQ